MPVKENRPDMIFLVGVAAAAAYFYFVGQLSRELLIFFAGIGALLLWKLSSEQRRITFDEARQIAKKRMEAMQREFTIPQGTLYLSAETWVKQFIFEKDEPEVEAYYYDVGVVVEGADYRRGYVVRVGIFGNIMGTSELDMPGSYRASKKDMTIVRARPKWERQEELAKKEKEQPRQEGEGE